MGPSRKDASSSKRHKKTGTTPSSTSAPGKTPGVSKLKAQLRQTRRLLAKVFSGLNRTPVCPVPILQDDVAADVRVETERRLKSLQKDLEEAEIASKERMLAVRYRRVKFFGQFVPDLITHHYLNKMVKTERQKLLRKINQVKKQPSVDEDRLFALRVDLNYVLVRDGRACSGGMRILMLPQHFPKLRKYVALFPPTTDGGATGGDAAREEVRTLIRGQMEKGEIANKPEEGLGDSGGG